jgi:hypothetical protein
MADLERRTIFGGYISKIYVNLQTTNDDVVVVETKKLSSNGDIFELDRRVISPNVIQTAKSLDELQPEISDTFPFKIVPPTDQTGKMLLSVPSLENEVTASQNYYTPIYFERYNLDILREIDKEFLELTLPLGVEVEEPSAFADILEEELDPQEDQLLDELQELVNELSNAFRDSLLVNEADEGVT